MKFCIIIEVFFLFFFKGPSYPPLDVWANSTSSTSIYVEWFPPANVDVNGIFYGFQIQYASANHSSALVPLLINTTSFNLTDLSK